MDRNFHMGYTTADIIRDMNKIASIPTGTVVEEKRKVKKIGKKSQPMFIRRTK